MHSRINFYKAIATTRYFFNQIEKSNCAIKICYNVANIEAIEYPESCYERFNKMNFTDK